MPEGTDKYDDKAKGGYSYAEKLAAVANDMMDPKEIGMSSAQEAQLKMLDQKPAEPKLGDFITFEASVVPPALRAHWARQDLKVVPTGITAKEWEQNWIKEHEGEFAIQGRLHSGTMAARVGQIFKDPILGFVELMRNAADILEQKYNELKANDPNPIITRDQKTPEKS